MSNGEEIEMSDQQRAAEVQSLEENFQSPPTPEPRAALPDVDTTGMSGNQLRRAKKLNKIQAEIADAQQKGQPEDWILPGVEVEGDEVEVG